MTKLYQMDGTDLFWQDLPEIEACVRRVYKAMILGLDGGVDWPLFLSPEGQRYRQALYDKLCSLEAGDHLAGWENQWEVRRLKRGISYTYRVCLILDMGAGCTH